MSKEKFVLLVWICLCSALVIMFNSFIGSLLLFVAALLTIYLEE